MTPELVTPPDQLPVTLDECKAAIGITFNDDDQLITALMQAAVAHLDGWSGALGRCIMRQTWRVTVDSSGSYVLPFPNVTSATATYSDTTTEALTITASGLGPTVAMSDAGSIEFTCAMPEAALHRVRVVIFQLVCHWYDHRSAAQVQAPRMIPYATQMLIAGLRWKSI